MSNDPSRQSPLDSPAEAGPDEIHKQDPPRDPEAGTVPGDNGGSDGAVSSQAAEAPTDPAAVKPASVLGMAASFATSMAKFAASGFQRVDAEIHDVRVARCADCEYFKEPRCRLCGCFTDKKAWLPHEDCPIGRWPV